jgi:hypothetical protein
MKLGFLHAKQLGLVSGIFQVFMFCSWYLSKFSIKVVISACYLISLDNYC